MGARRRHLRSAEEEKNMVGYSPLNAPPRPQPYPSTHTTPLHTTILLATTGNNWQQLATTGNNWQKMAITGKNGKSGKSGSSGKK